MRYRVVIPIVVVPRISGSFGSHTSKGFAFPEEPVRLFGVQFVRELTPPRVAMAAVDCVASTEAGAAETANLVVERSLHFISLKSGTGMATARFEALVQQLPDATAVTEQVGGIQFIEVFDTLQIREQVFMINSPLPQWFGDLETTLPTDPNEHRKLLRALDLFYRGLITVSPVPQFLCFFVALEMLVPPVESGLTKEQIDNVIASAVNVEGLDDDRREQLKRHLGNSLGYFSEVPKKEAWLKHLQKYWEPVTLAQVSDLINTRNSIAHGKAVTDADGFLKLCNLARWMVGQIFKKELRLDHVDWLT